MVEQSKKPKQFNTLHLLRYSVIFLCNYFDYSLMCRCPERTQLSMKVYELIFFVRLAVDEVP
jgi:hypothetical protein